MEKLSKKVIQDLTWVGVQDPNLKVFDIIMETEFGTTYNSYLLQGSEKTVLIETAKVQFFDSYVKKIEEILPVGKIDYCIVNHTEPDHVGSLEKLLELNPAMEVIGSMVALNFLKEIVNHPFIAHPVKDQEEIDLGGKILSFYLLPNLHWPDTMYTYWKEEKVLFSCDSFGAHYCFDGLKTSQITDEIGYGRAMQYYFNMILGPFKPFMNKALDVVEGLELSLLCPGHGPILDQNIHQFLQTYRQWSQIAPLKNQVVIGYVSAYGFTEKLAMAIAKGIEKEKKVKVILFELTNSKRDDIVMSIRESKGFLLGSPTILSEGLPPVWDVLSLLNPVLDNGKHAAIFGSYGWSGEAAGHLTERLKQLRLKVEPEFRVRFKPSLTELEEAENYGFEFAQKIV